MSSGFWYYLFVGKSVSHAGSPTSSPGAPSKPVSLRDLAAYLGLSRTTVSLVLNNSPVAQALTPETRERVLKAAAELHYKANYFARMLNNKRSQMVGVLSPDFGEGYDSQILTAIERVLINRNYLYFVSSHHWDKALIQQRLQVFAERGAEGLILINTHAHYGGQCVRHSPGAGAPACAGTSEDSFHQGTSTIERRRSALDCMHRGRA